MRHMRMHSLQSSTRTPACTPALTPGTSFTPPHCPQTLWPLDGAACALEGNAGMPPAATARAACGGSAPTAAQPASPAAGAASPGGMHE